MIPKFSGALKPGESSEVRRDQFKRWRNGSIKVLNLRVNGEILPTDKLIEVIPDAEDDVEAVEEDAELGESKEGA